MASSRAALHRAPTERHGDPAERHLAPRFLIGRASTVLRAVVAPNGGSFVAVSGE